MEDTERPAKKIRFIVNHILNEHDLTDTKLVPIFKSRFKEKFGIENCPLHFYRLYTKLIDDNDNNIKYLTDKEATKNFIKKEKIELVIV